MADLGFFRVAAFGRAVFCRAIASAGRPSQQLPSAAARRFSLHLQRLAALCSGIESATETEPLPKGREWFVWLSTPKDVYVRARAFRRVHLFLPGSLLSLVLSSLRPSSSSSIFFVVCVAATEYHGSDPWFEGPDPWPRFSQATTVREDSIPLIQQGLCRADSFVQSDLDLCCRLINEMESAHSAGVGLASVAAATHVTGELLNLHTRLEGFVPVQAAGSATPRAAGMASTPRVGPKVPPPLSSIAPVPGELFPGAMGGPPQADASMSPGRKRQASYEPSPGKKAMGAPAISSRPRSSPGVGSALSVSGPVRLPGVSSASGQNTELVRQALVTPVPSDPDDLLAKFSMLMKSELNNQFGAFKQNLELDFRSVREDVAGVSADLQGFKSSVSGEIGNFRKGLEVLESRASAVEQQVATIRAEVSSTIAREVRDALQAQAPRGNAVFDRAQALVGADKPWGKNEAPREIFVPAVLFFRGWSPFSKNQADRQGLDSATLDDVVAKVLNMASADLSHIVERASHPYMSNWQSVWHLVPGTPKDSAFHLAKVLNDKLKAAAIRVSGREVYVVVEKPPWRKARDSEVRAANDVIVELKAPEFDIKMEFATGCLWCVHPFKACLGYHDRKTDAWSWCRGAVEKMNLDYVAVQDQFQVEFNSR